MKKLCLLSVASLATLWTACTSQPPPAPAGPPATPTPTAFQRMHPSVIEDTPTYFIERLPKKDYIRVDDHHIRLPVMPTVVEFFKEDEEYYYTYNPRMSSEEADLIRQKELATQPSQPTPGPEAPAARGPAPPESDFTDITPARVATRFRLEEVKESGLPDEGMWRASFAIADMNFDGIPDIVAPPPRSSADGSLRIFLGDGKGHFSRWPLTFLSADGKVASNFSLEYGGVAVGDVDGDGKLDVIAASHGLGLTALFGDGHGTFTVSRRGLGTFSAQAVALADVNGDGLPDLIVSRDTYVSRSVPWNSDQVQVLVNKGGRAFELNKDALVDAAFSMSVTAWDYDEDGKADILLGSNVYGAVLQLFHNDGNGKLSQAVPFPDVEVWAYHLGMAPGAFGPDRAPAFADLFYKGNSQLENGRAAGINVHVFRGGKWERHRVWRKRMGKAVLTTLAFGDLDGDGLDDLVFPDSDIKRLRIFLQQKDGSFLEAAEKDEPEIGEVPQHVRLADLDGDGRLDVVLSKTVASGVGPGGWTVFLNRKK